MPIDDIVEGAAEIIGETLVEGLATIPIGASGDGDKGSKKKSKKVQKDGCMPVLLFLIPVVLLLFVGLFVWLYIF